MKQVLKAAWTIVAICVGIRIGANVIAPLLPMVVALVFVASIIFWAVAKH